MRILRKVGIFYAVVFGIAVTWTVAAFGLAMLRPTGCRIPRDRDAHLRILQTTSTVRGYRLLEDRCPTRGTLVAGGFVDARALVDPWGTGIAFHCLPDDDVAVRSAGPDRVFHTADDITVD
jgi:hypothetical protein